MFEIDLDIAAQSLYVLEDNLKLVGAISVVPENELDDRPEWRCRDRVREIARVVVSPDCRGNGYARLNPMAYRQFTYWRQPVTFRQYQRIAKTLTTSSANVICTAIIIIFAKKFSPLTLTRCHSVYYI